MSETLTTNSLTSNVIGPINPIDWVFLSELRKSIRLMKKDEEKYKFALSKEKSTYKKTLQKYLRSA